MSVTDTLSSTGLPVGTWNGDPVHSSASFAVKHMGVSTFRGRFDTFNATLTVDEGSAQLVGTVDVSSLTVKDPNLQGHLGSPDFFDIEQYPEITYRSTSLRREGDELIVEGELTIKGNTHAVESHGEISGPTVTPSPVGEFTKLGIALEAVVDRAEFGLEWNAPLPKGGFALANDVKLTVDLELVKG